MPKQKPLEKDNVRNVTLRMADELLARIDDRRRVEPDIPSRTEMMRRIIVNHLDAWEADHKK